MTNSERERVLFRAMITSEHFEVPRRCSNCPNLCETAGGISKIQDWVREEGVKALDYESTIRELLADMEADDPGVVDDYLETDEARENALKYRQGVAAVADEADGIIRGLADNARRLIDQCVGECTVRVRNQGGRIIEVTVCGSAAIPNGEGHEGAHVVRESATKPPMLPWGYRSRQTP